MVSVVTSTSGSLGLDLVGRTDELSTLLLDQSFCDVEPHGREWLRERYAQIIPLVLPAALHSVETGEAIPAACLNDLREAAISASTSSDVRFSVVLRGALPALRVFTRVMHESPRIDAGTTVLAMARAALVAQELGACWAEAWESTLAPRNDRCDPSIGEGQDPSSMELVAASPDLDDVEERMLELAAHGMSNEHIARATRYSRQAVGWHLSRIMRVWKTPNRTALVAVAFAKGVLVARSAPRAPLSIEPPDQAGTV